MRKRSCHFLLSSLVFFWIICASHEVPDLGRLKVWYGSKGDTDWIDTVQWVQCSSISPYLIRGQCAAHATPIRLAHHTSVSSLTLYITSVVLLASQQMCLRFSHHQWTSLLQLIDLYLFASYVAFNTYDSTMFRHGGSSSVSTASEFVFSRTGSILQSAVRPSKGSSLALKLL